MPVVGAQRKTLNPFRTVNRSIGPFVSDLRLQVGISTYEELELRACRGSSLGSLNGRANRGDGREPAGVRSGNVGA